MSRFLRTINTPEKLAGARSFASKPFAAVSGTLGGARQRL